MRLKLSTGLVALSGLIAAASAPAQASVTLTIAQSGADITISGGGTINTAALTFDPTYFGDISGILAARFGVAGVGPLIPSDKYTGVSGPTSFGSTGGVSLSFGTGDSFGVAGNQQAIYLPRGYISGSALSGATTFVGNTLAGVGLTPGTHFTYTWGAGTTADSFTVNVAGGAAVPEPASLALLGAGLLGLGAMRRRR